MKENVGRLNRLKRPCPYGIGVFVRKNNSWRVFKFDNMDKAGKFWLNQRKEGNYAEILLKGWM